MVLTKALLIAYLKAGLLSSMQCDVNRHKLVIGENVCVADNLFSFSNCLLIEFFEDMLH